MIEPKQENISDAVVYVPTHAKGNRAHPDCEYGVITSFNDRVVFVRYGKNTESQGTDRADLFWQDEKSHCDDYYIANKSKWSPVGSARCQWCGDEAGV